MGNRMGMGNRNRKWELYKSCMGRDETTRNLVQNIVRDATGITEIMFMN